MEDSRTESSGTFRSAPRRNHDFSFGSKEEIFWTHLLSAQGEGGGWQAVNIGFVGDQLLKRLGGIEEVVAELCADLAELLLDLVESLLGLALTPPNSLVSCLGVDLPRCSSLLYALV